MELHHRPLARTRWDSNPDLRCCRPEVALFYAPGGRRLCVPAGLQRFARNEGSVPAHQERSDGTDTGELRRMRFRRPAVQQQRQLPKQPRHATRTGPGNTARNHRTSTKVMMDGVSIRRGSIKRVHKERIHRRHVNVHGLICTRPRRQPTIVRGNRHGHRCLNPGLAPEASAWAEPARPGTRPAPA